MVNNSSRVYCRIEPVPNYQFLRESRQIWGDRNGPELRNGHRRIFFVRSLYSSVTTPSKVFPMKWRSSQCVFALPYYRYLSLPSFCVICLIRHINLSESSVNVRSTLFVYCMLSVMAFVRHLIKGLLTYLLTFLLTYILTYLLTHLLTHSLTHLLTYLQSMSRFMHCWMIPPEKCYKDYLTRTPLPSIYFVYYLRLCAFVCLTLPYFTLPYLTLPYFTLPYLTGKACYRLARRPPVGPMSDRELTFTLPYYRTSSSL